ncbi:flagellar hook-associated protein 2 [Alteribacter lacisalsi]|nr:flagellar hook-associated protein 2 [Alteribacter lacisalsi]
MRIGGLASGMDTQDMVRQLMEAERLPMQRMVQDRTWMEMQRDAFREVNLEFTSLRDSFSATGLGLRSTFNQRVVTSSDPSKVTAVGSANAQNASAEIEVSRLAKASTWAGDSFEPDGEFFTRTMSDWEDGPDFDWDENGAAELSFDLKRPGSEDYETVSIQVNRNDRVNDVISRINRSQLGVSAFVDQRNDGSATTVLTSTHSGEGADFRFGDDVTSAFMEAFGVASAPGESIEQYERVQGQDAVFTYNGYEMERETNDFTINGVRYTLHGETTGPVRINTATDSEAIYKDIMTFVEEYNELVDFVNGKLTEERHRDYPPLTSEQRVEMSDHEIELWEEKANSGLLRRDPVLSSAMNQMRTNLFSTVENVDGIFNHLSQIGLTTSRDFRDGGKIVIDDRQMTMANGERMNGEARLRYAIENHPEDLYQLFNASGTTNENGNVPQAERGLIPSIRENLRTAITGITDRAGREGRTLQQFSIGRNILQMEDRISNFERRLQQTEQRYWSQFTAMEKAVQQMNSQAQQMFSMMPGGMM